VEDVTGSAPDRWVLGAVLAGGRSTRFGSPKALAVIGECTALERVAGALREVTDRVVVITGDPAIAAATDLPSLPDDTPGLGPLGGIATALRLAADEGFPGLLCVAVDMPFVGPGLLRRILTVARDRPGGAVVPESPGRRGFEPLCAYYPVGALASARSALEAGERAPHRLLERLAVRRLPLEAIRGLGDPEVVFFNLNTPDDLARAQHIAAG
jgi:molybdopterin-guanine dinucleotide biosynthesis protein A